MPADDHRPAGMEIRSFHLVFRLERRLHRIDRWRLPFPHGVPVTAIGHATIALLAVVALHQLPGVGQLIDALPAPVAYVLLPAGCATAMSRVRIDGRPAHRHLLARAGDAAARQPTAAGRPATRGTDVIADTTLLGHAPGRTGYPHAIVTGPAVVRLGLPARAHARARTLCLTPLRGQRLARARVITVADGQRLRIRRPR